MKVKNQNAHDEILENIVTAAENILADDSGVTTDTTDGGAVESLLTDNLSQDLLTDDLSQDLEVV